MTPLTPLQKLGRQIGASAIDHPAYLVRTGMFAGAKAFFVEILGWHIANEVDCLKEEGWRAVFVSPEAQWSSEQVMVQLTEHIAYSDPIGMFEGVHLAIKVQNAKNAAQEIVSYYEHAGLDCHKEPANTEETKWFVTIPALFTFALEFITAPKTFNWQRAARSDHVDAQRGRH